jgi:hypothetical protein
MNPLVTDEPRQSQPIFIRANGVAYRFDRYSDIPKTLLAETNAALREGRATVTFGKAR